MQVTSSKCVECPNIKPGRAGPNQDGDRMPTEQEEIRHQLEVMSRLQVKAEIECLHSPGRYALEKLAALLEHSVAFY